MKLHVRDNFYLSSIHPNDKAAYLEHFNDKSISDTIPVIPYERTQNGIFDTLAWGLLKDDWQQADLSIK